MTINKNHIKYLAGFTIILFVLVMLQSANAAIDIVRPNSDAGVNWSLNGSTDNSCASGAHCDFVDETQAQPSGTGDGLYVYSSNDNATEIFAMDTLTNVSGVSSINVWLYTYSANTSRKTLDVTLRWDNTDQSAINITPGNGSFSWVSANFTGLSLTQSQLDSLEVKFTPSRSGGKPDSVELRIEILYADINYDSSLPADLTQSHYRWRNDDGRENSDWTTTTADTLPGNTNDTSIYSPADGWIFVAYNDISSAGVMFASSSDNGTTWSTSTILVGSEPFLPSISAPSTSTIYMTYRPVGSNLTFASSSDSGASWTTKEFSESPPELDLWSPDSSTIYIVYKQPSTNDLIFLESEDGAGTWASTTIDAGTANKPHIASFGTSSIFITYGEGTELWAAYSTDGGTSWSTSTVDSQGGGSSDANRKGIYAVSANDVFISYSDITPDTIMFASSSDGGATWSTTTVAYRGNVTSRTHGDLFATDADTMFISYYATTTSGFALKLATSLDSGASWTISTIDSGTRGEWNSIHGPSSGNYVYISYEDAENGALLVATHSEGSTATWVAGEDVSITISTSTTKRLRFLVSNEGGQNSSSTQYRIEYATSTAGPWTAVPSSASAQHWEMSDSTHITDGEATSNISPGLTDPSGKTFVAGELKDTSNQSSGIVLSSSNFTELEYSISATANAISDQTYYLRLTDAGTPLDTYSIYASVTIDPPGGGGEAPPPPPNQSPVADVGPDQAGLVGETLIFNGSASFDSDGSIVSYDWDFGDGIIGSSANVSHAYSSVGNYTVTLTVTDNEGLINSDTALVSITEPDLSTVSVDSVSYSASGGKNNDKHLLVTVAIIDGSGQPVTDASVSFDLNLDGAYYASESGTTLSDGTVGLTFQNAPSGCYEVVVTDIFVQDFTWNDTTPPNGYCK